MRNIKAVLFLSFVCVTGRAKAQENPDYFKIKSVQVAAIPDVESPLRRIEAFNRWKDNACLGIQNDGMQVFPLPGQYQISSTLVVIEQIVNLGAKLWPLVAQNRPSVNVAQATASAYALPKGLRCPTELTSWQTPKTQLYHVTYDNFLGMTVVDFTYRVGFTYGGQYKNHGQYIANAFIEPAHVKVLWGYTFESEAEVTSVLNVGSDSAPIAGLQTQVKWHVSSVLSDEQATNVYYLRGDGQLVTLQ